MTAETARRPDEAAFRELVRKKWTISLVLTALILVVYFGFILVLAFAKDVLTAKIGTHMTLGLPVGLGVILSACVLTGIYVLWANTTYDASVRNIIRSMRGKDI
ncbi:DUF485 domain-containing protein [Desulfolutivibrio sulfoxidireducens]|uniref:DUF485 domain-containing protein n=1 Tax=Desulfolutivibrio sulfoxidireducens TaxID=2773299 RepID=UPI00159D7E5A|nr:DUF485 domain-containing protein [Desulfolutivibrio sulfoxidireducens]QLA16321.1 DUF485 domain-containing protein [Desulfolutivibrio sulfoxidireducens]QLA19788.1 DUF485 domain-containing protein [Desulfolutivibrio sulfoxidireducens]